MDSQFQPQPILRIDEDGQVMDCPICMDATCFEICRD